MFSIIPLLFLLPLAAGVIWLQIFLSKHESRWPGLILPAVSFFLALPVLFFSIYNNPAEQWADQRAWEIVEAEDGTRVYREIDVPQSPVVIYTTTFGFLFLFLFGNIPTVFLLAIYAVCRRKYNRRRALDKMSALDLG